MPCFDLVFFGGCLIMTYVTPVFIDIYYSGVFTIWIPRVDYNAVYGQTDECVRDYNNTKREDLKTQQWLYDT